jgi:recombination protein RecA
MDVRKGEILKENGVPIGNRMKVKIVKNKVAPPFRECEFDNIYGKGISRTGEIMDLAVELDVIQKSGSWFSYNGQKLGQGRDNVKQMLADDESFRKEVEAKILEHMNELDLSAQSSTEDDAKTLASQALNTDSSDPADTSVSIDVDAEDDFEEFDPTE